MTINLNFNFIIKKKTILKLDFFEHIEELFHRIFLLFWIILLLIFIIFIKIENLIKFLKFPIQNIKFFQILPTEYFNLTLKLAFYFGLGLSSPFIVGQLILFLFPGFSKKEIKIVLFLFMSSLKLIALGLIFSYYISIPILLNFFFNYSKEFIEPFCSFNQYFEFIFIFFSITCLIFQIPIIIILIGLLNFLSIIQFLNIWRYIIILSIIFGAILTPSTDPITQIVLSLTMLFLYFSGLGILYISKKLFKL